MHDLPLSACIFSFFPQFRFCEADLFAPFALGTACITDSRKYGAPCCDWRPAPSSARAGHLVRSDASASARIWISLPRRRQDWCPSEYKAVQMPPGRRGWRLPAELIMLPLGRPSGHRHAASAALRARANRLVADPRSCQVPANGCLKGVLA